MARIPGFGRSEGASVAPFAFCEGASSQFAKAFRIMHQPMARMHAFPSLKTGTHLAPVNAFARKRSPLRQELPLKGLIFSELIRFMEEKQNPLFVEQVIAAADLPNDAAFSRIGVYPTAHALLLVGAASQLSGIPVAALCEEFGTYLFGRFNILYPEIMSSYSTAESLLEHVRGHIHEDVKVLYPDATPPEVTMRTQDDQCIVEYRSHRPLAHIACGLIRGCLDHFGDERKIEWVNCSAEDFALEDLGIVFVPSSLRRSPNPPYFTTSNLCHWR